MSGHGGPGVPGPEDDPFAELDAAYVFGALAPEERAAYERHLQNCDDCRSSVAALAGMPGLLARVPLERIDGSAAGPVPETLLPKLVAKIGRERRRSRWRSGATMGLAAACVIALLIALVVTRHSRADHGDGTANRTTDRGLRHRRSRRNHPAAPGGSSAGTTTREAGPVLSFTAIGNIGISATAQVQSVAWGTRITVKCHQTKTAGKKPYSGLYYLVIVGRDNSRREIAGWNALPGKIVQVEGDTEWRRASIGSLELVDTARDVVLTLAL